MNYRDEPESQTPYYGNPFDPRLDIARLESDLDDLRLKPASRMLAEHLDDLGTLFANRGPASSDKAEALLVEALVTWKLIVPGDHPRLAMANARLASFYRGLNEASQAAFYQNEAVTIMETLVRESRQPAFVTAAYLARMHEDLGFYHRKSACAV